MKLGKSARSQQVTERGQADRDAAIGAYRSGAQDLAWQRFHNLLAQLSSRISDIEHERLFAVTCFDFSNLCFALGRGFSELAEFLLTVCEAAERLGDRRSWAISNLHLGWLYYISERRTDAVDVFTKGITETQALGDEDIQIQAAPFIGLYYFVHGRFRDAHPHFQKAAQCYESGQSNGIMNSSGPLWLSYCFAYLGNFHASISSLDYYRRLALHRMDLGLATTFGAALGVMLASVKKNSEAFVHLSKAADEASRTRNTFASYLAKGGLAYYYFLEGRLKETRYWMEQAMQQGLSSGIIRQYASPFILEMLFGLYCHKIKPPAGISYDREIRRVMLEPNLHLRGVALRLRGSERLTNGGDIAAVEADLVSSESYLIDAGDPIQLGKTWLEMARLRLRQGDREQARKFAYKAWTSFSAYSKIFFPRELNNLLPSQTMVSLDRNDETGLFQMFVNMIQELVPDHDLDRVLARLVEATNRLFGAERGGVFFFGEHRPWKEPELLAACNLTVADTLAPEFQPLLQLVLKAYSKNLPIVLRQEAEPLKSARVRAVLCIPCKIGNDVQAVLYHDNSHLEDKFSYLGKQQLVALGQGLARYIEHLFQFRDLVKKTARAKFCDLEQSQTAEIITQSPLMLHILRQVDCIAMEDATVLILGETGVGKELFAKRIHRKSPRSGNRFVAVDVCAFPESLVESELFGYEKGAFSGAERQKPGRIELAHRGTLFIDEVGEIPKSIQTKLLRTLEEKTLVRLGGVRAIRSDFRLVAATNRDLAAETAAGRFREDLYHRLNVVPIIIPPLRERREDIPLLARHFVSRFVLKYRRPQIELSPEDEAKLVGYSWPGNVRELENVIERSVLLSEGKRLNLILPTGSKISPDHPFADYPTLNEVQRRYIRYVLKTTNGKIGGPDGAAEILGIKRTTLNNRMKRLGLR